MFSFLTYFSSGEQFGTMWHEFRRLRQQPPLSLSEPLVGEERRDWPRNLEFFWNGSSKELPAAYINHPQLAQRGNSICRELRCILFIEELLVIRPCTPSHSKSPAARQEAAVCLLYTHTHTKNRVESPASELRGGKKCLNESPVSSCVFRWCPVCSAKQGDLR